MEPFKHTITVMNKRYEYFITPVDKKVVFFECEGAGIAQRFLAEDIMALLIDLPELIIAEIKFNKEMKKQEAIVRFRVTKKEKVIIQKKAIKAGYLNISAFLRALALGA